MKDWLSRISCFYFAESEHRRFSERLKAKMSPNSGPDDLKMQALASLEYDMGKFPSEEPELWENDPEEAAHMESSMRQMYSDILRRIEETESYMWGLAIAGVYHVWERETRNVIVVLSSLIDKDVEKADFDMLCQLIRNHAHYDAHYSSKFEELLVCNLITNTVKHGTGPSYRSLKEKRPSLFIAPGLEGLRLGEKEFDDASAAIAAFWTECEKAYGDGKRTNSN